MKSKKKLDVKKPAKKLCSCEVPMEIVQKEKGKLYVFCAVCETKTEL